MSNTLHDMGGTHGYGAIPIEKNEPVFHEPWEGRVMGLMMTAGVHLQSNIDNSRSQTEKFAPADYLSMVYYERWFTRLERACRDKGLVTAEELEKTKHLLKAGKEVIEALPDEKVADAITPENYRRDFETGRNYQRQLYTPAAFSVGEVVRSKNMHPKGHTRLPRYARGKLGVVVSDHGGHVYPDTNATFSGEGPERLYTVSFVAKELWGPDANRNDTVRIDLWEPYLEKHSDEKGNG